MSGFFFPCMGLVPPDIKEPIAGGQFRLHRCRAKPTVFDCATLATHHDVGFPWKWLEIFVGAPDSEIEVLGCESSDEAQACVRVLQALLYLEGLSPFTMPVVVSHSVADYAGLNARDSGVGLAKLPEEARAGFRTQDGKISVRLHEPAMNWIGSTDPIPFDPSSFEEAASNVDEWLQLETKSPPLATARHALLVAHTIFDLGSSLLMCWQGLESLFPAVSTEVKFRISLLLAQLVRPLNGASNTYLHAKSSYDARSRVAHGNFKKLKMNDWVDAWNLLLMAMQAVQTRGTLPSADELTLELLSDAAHEPDVDQTD